MVSPRSPTLKATLPRAAAASAWASLTFTCESWLLQPADLVLELLLGDLGLAQVGLVGLLGVGQFLRVGGQVGLEFLQLAGQAAGQLQVAGPVVGHDAALQVLGPVRSCILIWLLSRSAMPAMRARAMVVLGHAVAEFLPRRLHQAPRDCAPPCR